jgi:hypothetical protein
VYFVSHKIVYTYDFAPLQSRLWNTLKIWPGMPGRYKQFARRGQARPTRRTRWNYQLRWNA